MALIYRCLRHQLRILYTPTSRWSILAGVNDNELNGERFGVINYVIHAELQSLLVVCIGCGAFGENVSSDFKFDHESF
jgi:hypothetical protein